MNDIYMCEALSLAERGSGYTSPNPVVGAILVKDGKIIGRGYHERFGGNHAEVNAIISAGDSVRGAALFVNLEPCNHFGRTPPCTDMIIKSGIKEVIIAHKDPNPIVNGKGIERLRKAGIKVKVGVLGEKAKLLNEIYLKFITQKRPFVILKAGVSLDGKIAARGGDSKWITSGESRDYVYSLRSKTDAVLVGIKTVLFDNPYLTSHGKGTKKNPSKVILDTRGRIPLDSNVFKEIPLNPPSCLPQAGFKGERGGLIVVTTDLASKSKVKKIEKMGAEVLFVRKVRNRINLDELLEKLGEKNITSLLVEGGSEVNGSFFDSRLIDKVLFFISPIIIGGKEAYSSVGGNGINALRDAIKLKDVTVRQIGRDYFFEGYPEYSC
ncbi:MAG: bifunctional diaminohydroxyphosphoribosylaminopyrimidine deaminase/5-amino-6-(5-phosphoribosylamino)uracil reductase RibD [bacterium]